MDINNISALTDYTSSLASAQSTDRLKNSARTAKTDDEMMEACKEFETYLWEQVIKEMKKSTELFSGEKQDQTVDFYMDSTITDIAGKLTEQNMGSNSLAMQMYEQMKRSAGALTLEEVLAKQAESGAVSVNTEEE